jgi:subtilase family serine protease
MEYLFIEALLQGISVVASSGDSGDNFDIGNGYYVPGVLAPNYPASSPLVTAVGGTALGIDAAGNRIFETAWGSHYEVATANNGWSDYGFVEGSGGGSSILFRKPWYQQSVAPNSTMRSVPDVAMDADPSTGMRIGLTLDGTWYSFPEGGTSLSAPLFAGMTAVSLEYAADRVHSHVRMGFLNPLIYNAPAAFTDVQGTAPVAGVIYPGGSANGSAAVFTFDEPSLTQHVTAGWDNATGLGVPTVGWVVAPWHVLAPAPTSASGTGSLIS